MRRVLSFSILLLLQVCVGSIEILSIIEGQFYTPISARPSKLSHFSFDHYQLVFSCWLCIMRATYGNNAVCNHYNCGNTPRTDVRICGGFYPPANFDNFHYLHHHILHSMVTHVSTLIHSLDKVP